MSDTERHDGPGGAGGSAGGGADARDGSAGRGAGGGSRHTPAGGDPAGEPAPQPPEHALLRVNAELAIPLAELRYRATRSGGPGGQHVNTSSTRVELDFDVAGSPSLSDSQRARITERLASRLDTTGTLHLASSASRSQHQNREDVTERLAKLLADALTQRKPRRKTRVPRAAKEARLKSKKRRAQVKKERGPVSPDE